MAIFPTVVAVTVEAFGRRGAIAGGLLVTGAVAFGLGATFAFSFSFSCAVRIAVEQCLESAAFCGGVIRLVAVLTFHFCAVLIYTRSKSVLKMEVRMLGKACG